MITNKEIVINFWFIVDIETELCYNWLIKPYCIVGSDNDKTSLLKTLAETDFLTVHRRKINTNFQTVYPNQLVEGKIPQELINNHLETYFDYYISVIEKELPLEFSFNFKNDIFGDPKAEKVKFPKSPLFVSTVLMENECGEIRPYTTEENKLWYDLEKKRLDFEKRSRNN
jgi:hypothetical protein